MQLISCPSCAVVLDGSHLHFPDSDRWEKPDGSIDTDLVEWVGGLWTPFVPCPVCHQRIYPHDSN